MNPPKQIAFVTQICAAPHPSEEGVSCGRPFGHPGNHLSHDHRVNWVNDAPGGGVAILSPGGAPVPLEQRAPAGPPKPCNARHPTGKACGLNEHHPGAHCTSDHLLSWSTFTPPPPTRPF